ESAESSSAILRRPLAWPWINVTSRSQSESTGCRRSPDTTSLPYRKAESPRVNVSVVSLLRSAPASCSKRQSRSFQVSRAQPPAQARPHLHPVKRSFLPLNYYERSGTCCAGFETSTRESLCPAQKIGRPLSS